MSGYPRVLTRRPRHRGVIDRPRLLPADLAGSVVVVADTRFFSTRNMEGLFDHDEEVLAFTEQLIAQLDANAGASIQ